MVDTHYVVASCHEQSDIQTSLNHLHQRHQTLYTGKQPTVHAKHGTGVCDAIEPPEPMLHKARVVSAVNTT